MSDKEWDQRILCSDGNCIGIIGSDGRCKECGQPHDGELPVSEDAPSAEEDEVVAGEVQEAADEDQSVVDPATDPDDSGDEWEDRTLCIDGNCIGIIGSDGRCKVCGKSHPGKKP